MGYHPCILLVASFSCMFHEEARAVQVIGATKYGRSLAVLGGPASTANAARQIEGVDLLVHPASSSAEDTSCSHAGTAGLAAKQAGAKHLCMSGVHPIAHMRTLLCI